MNPRNSRALSRACLIATGVALVGHGLIAQDRLRTMPGYARYEKMSREIPSALRSGALSVTWVEARAFEYTRDGKRYRFDVQTRTASEAALTAQEPSGRGGRGGPARGRQVDTVISPDGKLKASYRDRNLWLSDAAGGPETAITTDGSEKARIKYCDRELGVRGRAVTNDGYVVVARRFEDRLLPLRRAEGARLFPADRSDEDSKFGRCRSVPEGGRAKSDRRPVRLRCRREEIDANRRARREAFRRFRRWPLRLSRRLVS